MPEVANCGIRFELNAVMLIAEVMRRETHHNLFLHNAAARSFFREYSARCK
jgi:hypothetical protein